VPAKADPCEQAKRGRRTVLLVDAAHFVYGPFLCFLWCLVRRFLPGPAGRQRYNVPAALDAVTHEVIGVANGGCVSAESVCELLRRVARAGLPGPVTLVLDNARYQRCALLASRPLHIRSMGGLPSYRRPSPTPSVTRIIQGG
jgi:hypothetical protein